MNESLTIPNQADVDFQATEVSRQQNVAEQFQVAYHGIAGAIHRKRTERALAVEEKMDRKDALYANLGRAMVVGTSTGTLADKPKTYFERRADRKLDKKVTANVSASVEAYRAELSFKRNQARKPTSEQQKASQLKTINKSTKQGFLTAQEARLTASEVTARPDDWTSTDYGNKLAQAKSAEKSLEKTADKLEHSKWRDLRRKRAVKRAVKTERRSEKHANQIETIKTARDDRKILKTYYKAVDNNQVMFGPEEA